jgi:hypothetical protein
MTSWTSRPFNLFEFFDRTGSSATKNLTILSNDFWMACHTFKGNRTQFSSRRWSLTLR